MTADGRPGGCREAACASAEHRTTFERFVRGEPIAVEVGEIERELGALWQAGEPARRRGRRGLAGGALERDHRRRAGATALAGDQARSSTRSRPPCRRARITLCLDDAQRGGGAARRPSRATSCRSRAAGAWSTRRRSRSSDRPAPRRTSARSCAALQVAGVPTATFWLDPGAARVAAGARAPVGDATASCSTPTACLRPQQLFDLERLGDGGAAAAGRRSRLAAAGRAARAVRGPVRSAGGRRAAGAARRALTIRHRAGQRCERAACSLAWLGVLLGWRPLRSAQTSDGGVRFDFVRAGQRGRRRHLVPADGACGQQRHPSASS